MTPDVECEIQSDGRAWRVVITIKNVKTEQDARDLSEGLSKLLLEEALN
jgi:hypothetical protein